MSTRVSSKRAARVAREQREAQARARQRRRRTALTSGVAALVLILAGCIGYSIYEGQRPQGEYAVPAEAIADGSDSSGISLGRGPVTVEVYLDYLCPACRRFEEDAQDEITRYLEQERITLVLHPVAILDRFSTNEYSTRSAAAAGCAADEGQIVEYGTALYAQQPAEGGPGHTDDTLIQIATSIGLGDSFAQCVRNGTYLDWVKQVTRSMAERNVTSTPTVFVNGQQLRPATAATLTAAVDAA